MSTTPTPIPAIGSPTNPDIKVVGPTPNPLSGKTVPMFAASGELGDVPVENAKAARTQGFKDAVSMTASTGEPGYVPIDRVSDALQKGFVLHDAVAGITPETSRAMNAPETGLPGVGAGAAKGATDTIHGALKATAKYVGGMTDDEATEAANRALQISPADLSATTPSQKVGKGIESVAEFVLGDEALKGLSVAQKLGLASKIAEMSEKSPKLAKMIGIGMDAVRQGTVAGGEDFAKTGGDVSAAAKTGAEAAAGSALLGGAVEGARILRVNPFRAKALAMKAADEAAASAAADSRVATGAAPSESGLRPALDSAIDQVSNRERTTYDTVKKLSGTDLKSLYDERESVQDAIDDPVNIGNSRALQDRLQNLDAQIATGEQTAAAKGADAQKIIQQAKADTQQRFALQELKNKVFDNESVVSGNKAAGTDETININNAIKAVERLDKPSRYAPQGTPSRLQQALGPDGAANFKRALYDAQKRGVRNAKLAQFTRWAGGLIGAGVLGGLGFEAGKHLLP